MSTGTNNDLQYTTQKIKDWTFESQTWLKSGGTPEGLADPAPI